MKGTKRKAEVAPPMNRARLKYKSEVRAPPLPPKDNATLTPEEDREDEHSSSTDNDLPPKSSI